MSFISVTQARSVFRFQLPPVKPCMRFSRTRLTDAVIDRALHDQPTSFTNTGDLRSIATPGQDILQLRSPAVVAVSSPNHFSLIRL